MRNRIWRLRHARCVARLSAEDDERGRCVSHACDPPPPLTLNGPSTRFTGRHNRENPRGQLVNVYRSLSFPRPFSPSTEVLYEFRETHPHPLPRAVAPERVAGRSAKSTDVGIETHRLSAAAASPCIPGDLAFLSHFLLFPDNVGLRADPRPRNTRDCGMISILSSFTRGE